MKDEMKASVQKGIALLDEKVPNWRKRINLEKLDMGQPCLCVWGQANRVRSEDEYDDTLRRVGINTFLNEEVPYGFFTWDDWDRLTELWEEALS